MLTSDLDAEEEKDRAALDALLNALLKELDLSGKVSFKKIPKKFYSWQIQISLLSPRTTKLWRGYRVCPVRMYVSTYVRSFVCSPALATSFIIQFRYNFTQVLDMTIPRTSSRFSVIGSRSRSQ